MRLQCPRCEESTWYGISELDLTLTCGRCLRQFPFPEARPPKNACAYRVICRLSMRLVQKLGQVTQRYLSGQRNRARGGGGVETGALAVQFGASTRGGGVHF